MIMSSSKKVVKSNKLVTPPSSDKKKHEEEKADKQENRLSAQGIQPTPKILALDRKPPTPLKREARGKKAPPHLQIGTILCNRLKIERMMGGGGFGQVFKAINQSNNQIVAVKVEPCDREAGRMILEQKVLNLLRGTKHTPRLVASGNHENFMYIAMEMLGRNINDLRHRQPHKRFSLGTGLRVAVQMVEALKDIHAISYLHRDVKPSNMCVGLADKDKRTIFLVDFGMTRRYKNDKGEFRKSRTYAGFRGTLRYVSLTVHKRHDQGPKDDLWSLLYSMIEICEGSLPWKHIEDEEHMAQKKMRTPFEELLMYLPSSLKEIADHLEGLSFDTMPDYDLISKVYTKGIPDDCTDETPFDWDAINPSSKSLELESLSNN